MSTDKCRLCGEISKLRNSHLIPKFVSDWMKSTGTQYLRQCESPNVRLQDGLKIPLLCEECEQRFSRREKWFSESIFVPYVNRINSSFSYDESLYYFLVSVLWRTLQSEWGEIVDDHPFQNQLELAEYEWRHYLLGGRIPPTYKEIHLYLTDYGFQGDAQPVEKMNVYFARACDLTVVKNSDRCFVYTKFARFIVFGWIQGFHSGEFIGTKVLPFSGKIGTPQHMLDGMVGEFMFDRARSASQMFDERVSAKQLAVINEDAKKNAVKIANSDLGRVLAADFAAKVEPTMVWPDQSSSSDG